MCVCVFLLMAFSGFRVCSVVRVQGFLGFLGFWVYRVQGVGFVWEMYETRLEHARIMCVSLTC